MYTSYCHSKNRDNQTIPIELSSLLRTIPVPWLFTQLPRKPLFDSRPWFDFTMYSSEFTRQASCEAVDEHSSEDSVELISAVSVAPHNPTWAQAQVGLWGMKKNMKKITTLPTLQLLINKRFESSSEFIQASQATGPSATQAQPAGHDSAAATKLSDGSSDGCADNERPSCKNGESEVGDPRTCYRGQKNSYTKGKHAERKDVLYKTFLRSVRRYLWTMFSKENDMTKVPFGKASEVYRNKIVNFYNKHFKAHLEWGAEDRKEVEQDVIFYLSIIVTKNYSFGAKKDKERRITSNLNKALKTFSVQTYTKLFSLKHIAKFFNMLNNSGISDQIIDFYPKLSESKEAYKALLVHISEGRSIDTIGK